MTRLLITPVITIFFIMLTLHPAAAKPSHTFKIASLAPEGSVWVEAFKEFAKEVTEKTDGDIGFRIYPGGIMGDDRAMYRKMRVGQLHGGGFTMTGIAEVVPDFRVLAIPFLFRSYEEVDHVITAIRPFLNKRFTDSGLELVAMTEVGFIYTFSNQPRTTISDLQQAKTWAPSGDPITASFLENLDISPITLSIPDVLSSLQTGLIDTAFNSLYGSIVLQWFTKAPFVTDQPYGYAYGTFTMSSKALSKLTSDQIEIIRTAADKHFHTLILQTRASNNESRDVLSAQGVTFVPTTDDVVTELEKQRDLTIEQVKGKAFSEDVFQQLSDALDNYRSK